MSNFDSSTSIPIIGENKKQQAVIQNWNVDILPPLSPKSVAPGNLL
jgi:hypothetical protein